MTIGRVVQANSGTMAKEPTQVFVSNGTKKYPFGHPEYFSSLQPSGMLLLDLLNNEYIEFRVDIDSDCSVTLFQAMNGGRYKLFVYRTTNEAINVHFGNRQTYVVNGIKEGETQSLLILNIEVAILNGQLINRIGATSEKLEEFIGSLTTKTIRVGEDFTFNGVSLGGYKDGDSVEKGTLLHDYLKKTAQKTLSVSYSSPSIGLSPSNQSVEAGTLVTPNIITSFSQGDAGILKRYLLQLSTGGAANVSLIDAAILQSYSQASIVVDDGQHLKYTSTLYHDEGITKINNVGEEDPKGKILAGSLSKMLIYSGFRKLFYESDIQSKKPTSSLEIRSLTKHLNNPKNGTTFSLTIPKGASRVLFAYPAYLRDVNSVKYIELGGAEVSDTFEMYRVQVEGNNGFKPIEYKVYLYLPSVSTKSELTYQVTI
ncbi:hypothetical protein [Saccharicrinis aurantiacus]|uniref:hypothetical protein n=1 Tax=Saccharicrinis aurantiacus TaxID=1849719 RepID=UPI00094FBFD9|nr:hypothetical protein [Saccharicrinis aurantiacus]